jgi:hypothetical protein
MKQTPMDDITKATAISVTVVTVLLIPLVMMFDSGFSLVQNDDKAQGASRSADTKVQDAYDQELTKSYGLDTIANLVQSYDVSMISNLDPSKFNAASGKNPEEVLRKAYSQQALAELDRCLGSNSFGFLCKNNLHLLIESCKDPALYVNACDDPRLAEYIRSGGK